MTRKTFSLFVVLLTLWVSAGAIFGALAQAPGGDSTQGDASVQRTCPVIVGNKIDPNIYTDYKGKRVYFCCPKCKAAFEANPERYLDRLPQFAGRRTGREGEGRSGLGLGQLVEPFGVTTLSLLCITFCLGFFMKKNPKVLHKWHKRFAYVTIIVALCHATLVMLAGNF